MDMSIYCDVNSANPEEMYEYEKYDRKKFLVRTINSIAKNELTERQYEIYKMYYKQKMKMKEIAADEAITVSAVSKIIKRIENRLRRYAKYVNVR